MTTLTICRDCRHGMHAECHSPGCQCPCPEPQTHLAEGLNLTPESHRRLALEAIAYMKTDANTDWHQLATLMQAIAREAVAA